MLLRGRGSGATSARASRGLSPAGPSLRIRGERTAPLPCLFRIQYNQREAVCQAPAGHFSRGGALPTAAAGGGGEGEGGGSFGLVGGEAGHGGHLSFIWDQVNVIIWMLVQIFKKFLH